MSIKIDAVRDGCIYLSGDTQLVIDETPCCEKSVQTGTLFVNKTNIEGIYTYGLKQTVAAHYGHGPGYIWSSRASVMNAAFETTLYEAAYRNDSSRCYRTCAIDLVRFEDMLKELGCEVDFTPHVSEDGMDIHFNVKEPTNYD